MHFNADQLKEMSRFYRANLVNSLSGFKPAVLAGTADKQGKTNLALFSNIFHVGADPALMGYVQRPVGESGHSFRNIESTGRYTFNLVPEQILERAHFTSARFDPGQSEFDTCQLQPFWLAGFNAPFVAESPVKIGLTLADIIPYPRNGTYFVIGQVTDILVEDSLLLEDGNLELSRGSLLSVVGLEQYYRATSARKMSYARVENLPDF
jgi:flavin reductase (DIM6/NTAB) family NADH-FMN oxidoreductase RutF